MKKLHFTFMLVGILFTSFTFQSCSNDDDDYSKAYPNALVTVKSLSDSSCYLQLDDNSTLKPVNLSKSPFGTKEVRALVNYTETTDNPGTYTKAVNVNWIDSIRTKMTVPTQGSDNDKKFGNDPIEIMKDWVTIVEDGYLTLRFRTLWGGYTVHYINLLTGVNPENPYDVELRHNANGDTSTREGDGLIAFNLKDLPDTGGKTVKLKINWKSFSGNKSVEFDFCSRKTTTSTIMTIDNRQIVSNFK